MICTRVIEEVKDYQSAIKMTCDILEEIISRNTADIFTLAKESACHMPGQRTGQ